ncbi:MAG: ABC transporter ATP-binding protein, partial [Clostridiales bacterium]|nr:ABC transporter ATP-binding protein [Clostridiales bacterium]
MDVKTAGGREIKSNYNFAGYLRVAKYAKYIGKELAVKVLLGVCVTGTFVLQAVLLARGTGAVFDKAPFSTVFAFYMLVIICIGVRSLLVRFLEYYTKQTAGKLKAVLREMVVGKLLNLGPGYQADKRSGRFQSLVTDGIEYLEPYLVNYVPQVFITVFSVLPIVIYIFTLEATVGTIVAVSVLLAIVMPHFLMPFYTKACVGYWQEYAVLNSQYI